MKDLNKLLTEVLEDFDSLGIKYGKIMKIEPNYRAKSRWGQCCKRYGGFLININAELLADNVPDRGALDTIAHEVCHTIDGCMNHGAKWKHYGQLLSVYGYRVKRVGTAEDKGIDPEQHVKAVKHKYEIICGQCGHIYTYSRKGKIVTLVSASKHHGCRCAICGSSKLTAVEV